jgi:hypothetical protein
MLKISVIDRRTKRRLVLEGKLIAPWVAELRSAYETARADLQGHELVVEMKHITTISQEGDNVLTSANDRRNQTPLRRRCVYKTCVKATRPPCEKESSGDEVR